MNFGFASSLFEMLILVLLTGNPGVPLGVPPAEADPNMARVAPEECLYYVSWSGTQSPDPRSENSTERMLAQDEMQNFITRIDAMVSGIAAQGAEQGNPVSDVMARLTPLLFETALTQPAAMYVADVQLNEQGLDMDAGLLLGGGGKHSEIVALLNEWVVPSVLEEYEWQVETVEHQGQPFTKVVFNAAAPPLFWGVTGSYVLVTVGEDSLNHVFRRLETDPPSWLQKILDDADAERLSSVAFLNVEKSLQLAEPLLIGNPELNPELMEVLDRFELNQIRSYQCVTGLSKEGYLIQSKLATAGLLRPFAVMSNTPLTDRDMASVPADSPAACVFKLDPEMSLDLLFELLSALEPLDQEDSKADLSKGIEQMLGVSLEHLLTQILGDTVSLYASPTDGGLISGWLLAIKVKQPAQAQACAQRLQGFLSAMFRRDRTVQLRVGEFKGWSLTSMEVDDDDMPFVPTWGVSDSELVIGLYPQAVKSHMDRDEAATTLAQVPPFSEILEQADPMVNQGPKVMVQLDHAELIRVFYPLAQLAAPFMLREMQDEIDVDVELADLPSVAALTLYTQPMRGVLSLTRDGLEMRVDETLPTGDIVTSVPILSVLGLPAVTAARLAARRTQSVNNIKQIMLALHNYHDVHRGFPAAYNTDDRGKPLLSWRVHILPYIEQGRLYEQFHFDEPWDSEHNKKLIEQMPAIYAVPGSDLKSGLTNYLGVAGENGLFPPTSRKEFGKKFAVGRRFAEIRDGTSNTAAIVEVNNENRVIWTRPRDFEAPGMQPLQRLLGVWNGGFHAGVADGSVRLVPETVELEQLLNFFDVNDGKPLLID
jgi:hypothetical protein